MLHGQLEKEWMGVEIHEAESWPLFGREGKARIHVPPKCWRRRLLVFGFMLASLLA
jgi:hypothetical protein